MTEYNVFALNNISVPDDAVQKMFRLHTKGASINWELLHKAREVCLERYPNDVEQILEDFETEVYWTKKKLAKKGLLYETSEFADEYNDFDEDLEEDFDEDGL